MKIFIAHANQDREFARTLDEAFSQHGFDVWRADRIEPGQPWLERLAEAITQADVAVFLLSKASSRSEWLRSEAALAVAASESGEGPYILPVRTSRDIAIPPFFATHQVLDLEQPSPATVIGVLDSLRPQIASPSDGSSRRESGHDEALRVIRVSELVHQLDRSTFEALLRERDARLRNAVLVAVVLTSLIAAVGSVIAISGAGSELTVIVSLLPAVVGALGTVFGFYFGRR